MSLSKKEPKVEAMVSPEAPWNRARVDATLLYPIKKMCTCRSMLSLKTPNLTEVLENTLIK